MVLHLGSQAIGRLAIGQTTSNPPGQVTLTGVSGRGVVGALAISISNAVGNAVGIGVAGSLASSIAKGMLGVAAAGVVGLGVAGVSLSITGVSGTGTVGGVTLPGILGAPGVAGIGVARAPVASIAIQISGAAAIGTIGAAQGGPGGNALGVAAGGAAGILGIQVSGGGTSERLRRDPRIRTGFEPIKKRFRPEPAPPPEPKIQLPPASFLRALAAPPSPRATPPLVDPALMPDVEHLISQIQAAEQASRELEARRKQDEEDIAALLAFLDSQETT